MFQTELLIYLRNDRKSVYSFTNIASVTLTRAERQNNITATCNVNEIKYCKTIDYALVNVISKYLKM